ncbi:hypothetical protein NIES970_01080 [[Synechococcus] sp. NIES-970]|nr:hypothetical protein NIES970_01080 [[Synechococcus] sp. NIES-970]
MKSALSNQISPLLLLFSITLGGCDLQSITPFLDQTSPEESPVATASNPEETPSEPTAPITDQGEQSFTLDFETGDLHGWTQTGDAFQFQPTLDDNPTARDRGMPAQHQGRYWIGTYEKYQGQAGQTPGEIQDDAPQGTLTSPEFTIPGGTLSFLVGGGSGPDTRVELLVNGQPVLQAFGQDTETMTQEIWDLTPFQGRIGVLRIVDQSSEAWGHINVDDFRFSEPLQGAIVPRNTPSGEMTGSNFDGTWDTTWGQMTLSTQGNTTAGSYGNGESTISGIVTGDTFTGYWVETAAARSCDTQKNGSSYWGGLSFRLVDGGSRFEGSWSYCDDPVSDGGDWTGTRQ